MKSVLQIVYTIQRIKPGLNKYAVPGPEKKNSLCSRYAITTSNTWNLLMTKPKTEAQSDSVIGLQPHPELVQHQRDRFGEGEFDPPQRPGQHPSGPGKGSTPTAGPPVARNAVSAGPGSDGAAETGAGQAPERRRPLAHGRQDEVATLLGALIFTIFTYLFYDTLLIPTTPLDPIDARLIARAFHYTLGLSVWLLVSVRLFWWWRGPRPSPPLGLPPASFAFNRAILLALLITFFVTGILGVIYSYGDAQPVSFYGFHLPTLLPTSYPLRAFGGYFHSSLGFYYLGLLVLWLVVGIYQHLRYRTGLMRLLPGARV